MACSAPFYAAGEGSLVVFHDVHTCFFLYLCLFRVPVRYVQDTIQQRISKTKRDLGEKLFSSRR